VVERACAALAPVPRAKARNKPSVARKRKAVTRRTTH
jgi:hypothetical protein